MKNELITSNMSLVRVLAVKSKLQLAMDELIAAGNLGLVVAAHQYNEGSGPFMPYASKLIKFAMIDECRRHSDGPSKKYLRHKSIDDCSAEQLFTYDDSLEENWFDWIEMERILPKKDVGVLKWRFVEGLTYKQIGERLGIGESMVSRIFDKNLALLKKSDMRNLTQT
jgi:RNA polymerase sigma factor (sigma-70 family)